MSLFLDIPPPSPKEVAASAEAADNDLAPLVLPGAAGMAAGADVAANEERPEIEGVMDWAAAEEMLPKTDMGSISWVAAREQGIIKPRPGPGSTGKPAPFNLDFFLPGPDPSFDAYFPHSAHTPIIECKTCHTALFRYRDNQITMGDLYEGKYCATCHGKVGFGLEECARCHRDM